MATHSSTRIVVFAKFKILEEEILKLCTQYFNEIIIETTHTAKRKIKKHIPFKDKRIPAERECAQKGCYLIKKQL